MHRKSRQQQHQHQQQAIFHKRIICKGPRVICLCFVPYARALSSGFPFIVPIVLCHVFFFLCCFSFCCRFYLLLLFCLLFVSVCVCFFITPQAKIFCAYTKFAPSTNYPNNTERVDLNIYGVISCFRFMIIYLPEQQ